ncbi:MAG: hypothetical protein D9V47_09915 [Clostridia bacterium]|nr:MAG: hypothetical protein D9V47_09915 [Clostridia bacterium]
MLDQTIRIDLELPRELFVKGRESSQRAKMEALKRLAATFYADGSLSLGKAAELAKVSKQEIADFLATCNIPLNYDVNELEDDLATIAAMWPTMFNNVLGVNCDVTAISSKDLTIARKVKQSLTEKIPLYEVRLFGSRARGQASADSDLDLYLETGPLSREQRRLISEVAWEIGFANDVVISPLVVSQGEASNGAFSVSTLCRAIKAEGISV